MTATIAKTNTIECGELRQLLHEDPNLRIVDVRTGGEFETVHIPGSHNVPLDTLGQHVEDLAGVDHPVVLVCLSGGRAAQAHEKLTAAGKETVLILEGGIASWEGEGGDVVRGANERWTMDRQVRFVAGSVVLAGVVASVAVPKAKWLAGGVGGGLFYSAVSNSCGMAAMLSKLPYNRTASCDIVSVVDDLNRNAA